MSTCRAIVLPHVLQVHDHVLRAAMLQRRFPCQPGATQLRQATGVAQVESWMYVSIMYDGGVCGGGGGVRAGVADSVGRLCATQGIAAVIGTRVLKERPKYCALGLGGTCGCGHRLHSGL